MHQDTDFTDHPCIRRADAYHLMQLLQLIYCLSHPIPLIHWGCPTGTEVARKDDGTCGPERIGLSLEKERPCVHRHVRGHLVKKKMHVPPTQLGLDIEPEAPAR
jgi:hypothetical protein